jgi:DNA-directed RNA polymerase II subunit RPB7
MREYLKQKLLQDVEGTCTGQYGYIICILDIDLPDKVQISPGKIIPGNGLAEFEVKYSAIIFKPYKGEVVDAIVVNVNKMGFFAEVGPLTVFVSSHMIPSDMKFDPTSNPPAFVSEDQVIDKSCRVRLKILGLRMDVTEIHAIGTVKEDYLGIL